MRRTLICGLIGFSLSLGPFAASTALCQAGVVPGRWEKFDKKAKAGDTLYVETSSGLAVWGVLKAVDADSFRLARAVGPDLSIRRSDTLRVEKPRSGGAPIVILFPASVGLLVGAVSNPKAGLIAFGALETLEVVGLVRQARKIKRGERDTELLFISKSPGKESNRDRKAGPHSGSRKQP